MILLAAWVYLIREIDRWLRDVFSLPDDDANEAAYWEWWADD